MCAAACQNVLCLASRDEAVVSGLVARSRCFGAVPSVRELRSVSRGVGATTRRWIVHPLLWDRPEASAGMAFDCSEEPRIRRISRIDDHGNREEHRAKDHRAKDHRAKEHRAKDGPSRRYEGDGADSPLFLQVVVRLTWGNGLLVAGARKFPLPLGLLGY